MVEWYSAMSHSGILLILIYLCTIVLMLHHIGLKDQTIIVGKTPNIATKVLLSKVLDREGKQ